MNPEINTQEDVRLIEPRIKVFLINELGLDISKYNGFFATDTRYVVKIDATIVHINHDFSKYRAYVYE